MSEQNQNKPGEGAAAIDLEKYVPKETLGKLQSDYESLKKTLEDEKLKLLDPEYLEYLETKRNKKVTQADVDKAKAAGLPQAAVDIIEEMKGRLVRTETVLQNVAAVLELQQIERAHPDFNDYREEVQKLLEADKSNTLTFEQAYWQAKGQNPKPPKSDAGSKPNEKPGNFIPAGGSSKTFKNESEASQDALSTVRAKYGITGDII